MKQTKKLFALVALSLAMAAVAACSKDVEQTDEAAVA